MHLKASAFNIKENVKKVRQMLTDSELAALGLSSNQSRLYLAILQIGGGTAAQLAKIAQVKRSNAYNLLDKLCVDDLIEVHEKKGKKFFTAKDPGGLRRKLHQQLSSLDGLMPELMALYDKSRLKPKISYFEGPDCGRIVMEDLLSTKEGQYRYFGSLTVQLAVEGDDHAEELVRRRVALNIKSMSIRPRESKEMMKLYPASQEYLREVRYFPKKVPDNIPSIFIYDRRLAVVSSQREEYALIVESVELAGLMNIIWNFIWEISEL